MWWCMGETTMTSKVNEFISNMMVYMNTDNIFVLIINLLLFVTVLYALGYYLNHLNHERKRFRLRSGVVTRKRGVKVIQKFKSLRNIYEELEVVLATKGREHITDTVFYIFMGVLGSTFLLFIFFKIYIMAVIAPIALAWYAKRLIHEMKQDSIVMIERTLPSAIDNLIRVASSHNDIKTIVFETSKTVNEPLRGILDTLSSRMISRNPREVLDEFAHEYDNVWLSSFAFTLISYLEDSDKEATINNLKNLRDILYQENEGKVKLASERKYGIMINYALAVAGVIVAIANILFNPSGKEFFFHSFFGLICLVGGFATILGTVTLNVRLGKIKK